MSIKEIFTIYPTYSYYGNTIEDILKAVVIFLISWILLSIFKKVLLAKFKKLSQKTENKIDDILTEIAGSIGPFSYPAFSIYLSLKFLNIPFKVSQTISIIFILIVAHEVIKAFKKIFDFYIDRYVDSDLDKANIKNTKSIMQVAKIIMVAILWIIVILLVLSNLGVNINSVIASLGIGGIAIALAVQNILGDLLSSFSIYLDKPFVVGDFIVIDANSGIVEKIGIKSTRLRTLTGEQLVISNKELTTVRIANYKKMEKRREEIRIGVVYGISKDKLVKIPKITEKIISQNKDLEFLRCHFVEMADFSLIFSLMYYVNNNDYNLALTAKQQVLLDIYDQFNKEKIEFAYPTQEIVIRK